MERTNFKLTKFRLEDKTKIEVTYKNNGRVTTHEFSAPVHKDLYEAFVAFDSVFVKLTGMNPENKAVKIEDVQIRTVHCFEGGDERSLMLTEVIKWRQGYSNSMNTPREPFSVVREISGIDVEQLFGILEDEVFELLEHNKLGHEQSELFPDS